MSETKKLYIKFMKYNGYDDFYTPLIIKDGTWKEILDQIENVMDDKYVDNDNQLLGMKVSFEIVDTLPQDIVDGF